MVHSGCVLTGHDQGPDEDCVQRHVGCRQGQHDQVVRIFWIIVEVILIDNQPCIWDVCGECDADIQGQSGSQSGLQCVTSLLLLRM
jgi:hypothetical protein